MNGKAIHWRSSCVALAATLAILAPVAGAQGACANNTAFLAGSGIYDITGPAAEVGMMGYAKLTQKTAGIHQRLRARAFVIASPCNGKRVAIVSADLGMLFQGVKQQVVERLKQLYKDTYSDANTLLSATHTHSGPGGYAHYALYNLTILGHDKQNFDAIVDGIVQAISRAHASAAEGTIRINTGDVPGAGINRSLASYNANPPRERAQYLTDTDRTMTLLRLQGSNGFEFGSINWFALHPTSMGNDNRLISGDNKGYASHLLEKDKRTDYRSPKTFVAAFAQSNEGDVSPNIFGGTNGGGANDFESTEIAARKQYEVAKRLYDGATRPLTGAVDYRHTFVRMDAVSVDPRFTLGSPARTCPASLGISMLAGAEDGPGVGDEGVTCAKVNSEMSNGSGQLFFKCSPSKTTCQEEKPITLDAWKRLEIPLTIPWMPEVLPLQIVTIGNLAIVAVPYEMTTMAGRRLRRTVLDQLSASGVNQVVIAGLANAYAGYLTTREEYAQQEYEGASTYFGPWSLAAVQQEAEKLAIALRSGAAVPAGPQPRDLRNDQTTLQTGVAFDDKPITERFGGVVLNANAIYRQNDTVRVKFWGGHPKNNLRRQGSYLQVQRQSGKDWITVANDWDWETKYMWERVACVPTLACSHVTVEWKIPPGTPSGIYRIQHDGDWKSGLTGAITPYTGWSREFNVQ